MELANFNLSSGADPWAYFYAISNDTDSERYIAWLNAVNASMIEAPAPPQAPPPQDKLLEVIGNLKLIYRPLIISVGIIGNTLTFLIFLCSRLRSLSSSHYLAAIVIVNTLYLLSLFIHWLGLFGFDTYNKPGLCQFFKFINEASGFLSIWYLTAFAVDRYICICWPAEAPKMCTRTRARVVIICILCIGIVVFMNMSLTVGVIPIRKGQPPRCSPFPLFYSELRILKTLDLVVNKLLPYFTIFILTILILYNTCKVWRQRLLSDNPAQIRNVTLVFLAICLVFHLPSEICYAVYNIRNLLHMHKTRAIMVSFSLLQHIFHTSLAIHFFIFAASYPMFRHTFKTPFTWLRERLVTKFRKAPNGDIHLRNVRFHAVQDDNNVAHV